MLYEAVLTYLMREIHVYKLEPVLCKSAEDAVSQISSRLVPGRAVGIWHIQLISLARGGV